MRVRSSLAALACALSVSLSARAHDPCEEDDVSQCGKAARFDARPDVALFPARDDATQTRESLGDTDVLHCDLEIEIFPPTRTLAGQNTMTVRSLIDGLTQFTFRLHPNLSISAVTLNGTTAVPPASIQSVGQYGRVVAPDRAYDTDELFTIRIEYGGAPESRGFGSIEFRTQGGNPLVYTLSEPYHAATWWPVKDGDAFDPGDNKDKFTIDTAIIAPSALTSVSNGLLVGVDDLGTRRRFRWSSAYPTVAYLVFFSSSLYNTWSAAFPHADGVMPVEFAIFPSNDSAANRTAWELCIPMLGTLGDLYGEYPFIDEKYGIYNFGFTGGMEHQTYTGQGGFGESLTAHELAHQWWGDNVTCRTWHDIWLNEGFATYSEALWYEHKAGSSGYPAYLSAIRARRPADVGDTVYVYDTSNYGRVFSGTYTYRKGAWVLHMLRGMVGQATLLDILSQYRAAFQGSAATTDEFAAIASAVSGIDLTTFFQQWVYLPGAPQYQYGRRSVTIAGAQYLQFFIRQSQPATYPIFQMPLDVRIDWLGGSASTRVSNAAYEQHYLIPVGGFATNVVLDEFDWVLNIGKIPVQYFDGPPKIVSVTPSIDAEFSLAAAPTQATIQFSEHVTAASAGDFGLAGPGGPIPLSLAYDPFAARAVLTFDSALQPGQYQLTVYSTLRSGAALAALDGEINPAPTPFPTGDGLPGGDAIWTFRIHEPCPADLDQNFTVDLADLAILLANFGTTGGATADQGDLDGDGDIELQDLALLLAAFGAECP